jgi:hypothetical protein
MSCQFLGNVLSREQDIPKEILAEGEGELRWEAVPLAVEQ